MKINEDRSSQYCPPVPVVQKYANQSKGTEVSFYISAGLMNDQAGKGHESTAHINPCQQATRIPINKGEGKSQSG